MDPGHKARKKPSDNADLGFQAAYEKKKYTYLKFALVSNYVRYGVTATKLRL